MTTRLPRLAECRLCHDPIRFVHLDTGKALPINPMPDSGGNVCAQQIAGKLHGFVISREKRPKAGAMRFKPHHATCPGIERKPPKPKPEPDPALF